MCLILGLGLWVVKPLTDSYGLLGQLPPFKERRSPKDQQTNKLVLMKVITPPKADPPKIL